MEDWPTPPDPKFTQPWTVDPHQKPIPAHNRTGPQAARSDWQHQEKDVGHLQLRGQATIGN